METIIQKENFGIILSLLSLVVALYTLYINFRNRITTKNTFELSHFGFISTRPYLYRIRTTQKDGFYIVHLSIYNASSGGMIIHSLTSYIESPNKNFLLRFLGILSWEILESSRWWPTKDPGNHEERLLHDAYKDIYVKDTADILVKIPGYINRSRHRFRIATNLDISFHTTTVDGFDSSFPYYFARK